VRSTRSANTLLNIRSLTLKLALEEIGAENSRAGIGKTYRVFNYTTILERRRATGVTGGSAAKGRSGETTGRPK
jgi:hypothetical protein